MRNIKTVALSEIWKQHSTGSLPVLLEIYNPDIVWNGSSLEQDDMYLRVINDNTKVKYNGDIYLPCQFNIELPEENGSQTEGSSITISNLDSRVMQLLRSVKLICKVTIVASFLKVNMNGSSESYAFYPLSKYEFKMDCAVGNRATISLTLSNNSLLSLNIPRDMATQEQLPSVNSSAN